jgi:hypothetical protein
MPSEAGRRRRGQYNPQLPAEFKLALVQAVLSGRSAASVSRDMPFHPVDGNPSVTIPERTIRKFVEMYHSEVAEVEKALREQSPNPRDRSTAEYDMELDLETTARVLDRFGSIKGGRKWANDRLAWTAEVEAEAVRIIVDYRLHGIPVSIRTTEIVLRSVLNDLEPGKLRVLGSGRGSLKLVKATVFRFLKRNGFTMRRISSKHATEGLTGQMTSLATKGFILRVAFLIHNYRIPQELVSARES